MVESIVSDNPSSLNPPASGGSPLRRLNPFHRSPPPTSAVAPRMVNKRQKLARKIYKEEHPDLFPKSEPAAPKDPTKTKGKKSKLKPKRAQMKGPNSTEKSTKSKFRKHPFRVLGMKPGESCFICKAKDHIAKHCPLKAQWEKHKICLLCRQRGHSLKNCPDKSEENSDDKLCYNCGQRGHSLAKCPQPLQEGGTKFASCFICKEQGHLSKNCPKNTHGIYPKGGCCKVCGGVTHLAKDCPNKGLKNSPFAASAGAIEHVERPRITKFTSGDDLDDDFMATETLTSNTEDSSQTKVDPAPRLKTSHVKPKRKQGPTVVNFVG